MTSKRLTVVIPCYNHGEYLAEAVESVRQVRRNDVELIVVDDGSTDDYTRKEMDRLSSEGVFVIRQKNGGLAAARNAGIRAAKGEYILPLDADNRIHPDYANEGIRILDTNPRVGVVYADANYFGTRSGRWRVGPFDKYRLLTWNFIDACAVYRRTVWEQNQGYDGTMPVQGLEDWDFWLGTMAHSWLFFYVPRILFDYRVGKESMITQTYSRKAEITRFITAKHSQLYVQAFLALNPTSLTDTLHHAKKLLQSKIAEKTWRVRG